MLEEDTVTLFPVELTNPIEVVPIPTPDINLFSRILISKSGGKLTSAISE